MATTYRMFYDPQICNEHYKGFTIHDLAYICAFYGKISSREIAISLGRTQKSIQNKVRRLKLANEFDGYKSMYERL